MKERKRCFSNFSFYDQQTIQAEQEGVFLAVKSRRLASWLLLLFSCLWLILAYSGASTTNRSDIFALIAAVIGGGFTLPDNKKPVGTYELYGRTREIYDDFLPLMRHISSGGAAVL